MGSKKTPIQYPVSIEVEGKAYSAYYTVESKVVAVFYEGNSKATQVGNSPPQVVASWLLRELVQAKSGI